MQIQHYQMKEDFMSAQLKFCERKIQNERNVH